MAPDPARSRREVYFDRYCVCDGSGPESMIQDSTSHQSFHHISIKLLPPKSHFFKHPHPSQSARAGGTLNWHFGLHPLRQWSGDGGKGGIHPRAGSLGEEPKSLREQACSVQGSSRKQPAAPLLTLTLTITLPLPLPLPTCAPLHRNHPANQDDTPGQGPASDLTTTRSVCSSALRSDNIVLCNKHDS